MYFCGMMEVRPQSSTNAYPPGIDPEVEFSGVKKSFDFLAICIAFASSVRAS
jgi:hypothetical protein